MAAGFDRLVDAVDFLYVGYEDNDLIPLGIYDTRMDQITPYGQDGQFIGVSIDSLAAIRSVAMAYIADTSRLSGPIRPDAA